MEVVISEKTRHNVYHRPECVCVSRMDKKNQKIMSREQALYGGYRACKCCGNGQFDCSGIFRESPRFEEWEEEYHMSIDYIRWNQVLYVRTQSGCWRISRRANTGFYDLFHMNNCKSNYDPKMTLFQVRGRQYHRQSDVKPSKTIHKLLVYIHNHDKAKLIIMEDYRKLPRRTAKQKKYYKQAQRADRRKSVRRVYDIFEKLEQEAMYL